jgi:cytochrome o ubiquinol oxidase subunit II
MSKKQKLVLGAVFIAVLLTAAVRFLLNSDIAVLQPAGIVGQKEKNLMIIATLLCLIVVIPVFIMTFYIAWKYREGNKTAKYQPGWDHDWKVESVWWGIPLVIITVLAVVTWNSAHDLDPFKSLASANKPLTVQVVALPWKWLFIYPQQGISTVNYLEMPVNTPVNFQITADAPMNSFWIPQLGGQVYAMSGMSTQLHLMADKTGSYIGRSANISGRGFAGMQFTAKAATGSDFSNWVSSVKRSPDKLTVNNYSKLALESENNPIAYYSGNADQLYDNVIMKYMMPGHQMGSPSDNSAAMEHNFYH